MTAKLPNGSARTALEVPTTFRRTHGLSWPAPLLATAVVLLATLEAASIIFLLGAEVVATLERRARFGMENIISADDARVG